MNWNRWSGSGIHQHQFDGVLGDVSLPDRELSDYTSDRILLAAVVSSVLGATGITGASDELTTAITDALEQALEVAWPPF